MNRYWISWDQPGDDYRPLADPPNAAILGWWCSGNSLYGATLCALVYAKSDWQAKLIIRKDWPEASEWRFCDAKTPDFLPGDRFPLNDWMKKRVAK